MITNFLARYNRVDREPFQLWVVAACFVGGIAGLLSGSTAGVIGRFLPATAAAGWFLGLSVGGAVCLIALAVPAPYGLLIERIGMYVLGFLLAGYGLALLFAGGPANGVLLLSLAGACFDRLFRIGRQLRDLRRAIADLLRGSKEPE